MKKLGIRSIVKKKYKPYPSKEKVIQRDNLLKQDFTTNTSKDLPLPEVFCNPDGYGFFYGYTTLL